MFHDIALKLKNYLSILGENKFNVKKVYIKFESKINFLWLNIRLNTIT